MIRYRILFLSILFANFLNVTTEGEPNAADQKIDDSKPPDKTILRKSTSYSHNDSLIDTITNWLTNPVNSEDSDLTVSASEYAGPKYLPPTPNYRGYARSCYECNSVPWIPIAGRSLRFSPSSHSNSLEEASHYSNSGPYFKGANKHSFYQPPIDQYGAPQGSFHFPPAGEVVEFMLPPPYKSGYQSPNRAPPIPQTFGNLGPPPSLHQKLPPPIYKSINNNFKPPSINYGIPSSDILSPPPVRYGVPSPTPSRNYDIPLTLPPNYGAPSTKYLPTTHLRPVSQDFQPPLPGAGIHTLPLENNLPPPAPSDSYGRPITDGHLPSDSYGAPTASEHSYVEPITLGSGDSEENNGKQIILKSPNHFGSQQSLYQKGLTDVQVVPSVRIADYTASIEHPINLIQSPILDLNVKDLVSSNGYDNKLSEKPIVVEDTYTSASNINTTYSAEDNAIKRHNDKFLSSETFSSNENKLQEADLTNNIIQKLIFEHNDPKTSIVGVQKTTIDPNKVHMNLNLVQPSVDYSSWTSVDQSTISSVMVPPRSTFSTWLTPLNVTAKQSKKLQIIVPYLREHHQWNQGHSTAIYNREYTTLAPVFVPPAMTTEASNLWTQFAEGLRTVQEHKEQAQGFIKPVSTTEVYNIKDFLTKQHSQRPYDIISLQKNIDDWTHQAYANRHNIEGKLTTKLAHVKEIPEEYFTTTPYTGHINDHVASESHKKEFVSKEIQDNFIIHEEEEESTTTLAPNVKFIVRQPKPSWEANKVTLSNSTHEKVYVVTPQSYTQFLTSTPPTAFSMAPKIQNGKVNNAPTMTKISVRVEAPSLEKGVGKELRPVKVVYSEWPHLINNLITTTTTRPTTRHPLFGLMDLAPYTASPNTSVETIGGHSKVTNAATSSVIKVSNTTPMPTTSLNGTVKVSPVP